MKNTKHCIQCRKLFEQNLSPTSWKRRKFCSLLCRYLYGKPIKICPICGKEFRSWRYQNHRFCSKLCGNRSRPNRGGKIELICKKCKKGFIPKRRGKQGKNTRFCSLFCKNEYQSGKNHWNWKGGISRNHRRETKEYKEWRLRIYRRDYFKCQDCKKHCSQANIVAHHLKNYDDYPKLRYKMNNGITLCRHCHKIRH